MGNLLFSGKQRISLSTNFPVYVNEGKLVDKGGVYMEEGQPSW